MTTSEATKLIVAKAAEAPASYHKCGKAAAMYWAATELWNAEYHSWQAIASSSLGPFSRAAECAWERRSAYSDASALLLQAW
jgi:hypothetical protein